MEPMPFQTSVEALGQILHFAQDEFANDEEFIRSVCEQLSINTGINFFLSFPLHSHVVLGNHSENSIAHASIESLHLPVRVKNFLASIKITTLTELVSVTEKTLICQPHCGRKTLNIIKDFLAVNHLSLMREE